MTINYLKPFEPGDPIDINVLNKLIQNVNYLSSQIAQIYKLPAVEAPVIVSGTAIGSTSGSSSSPGTTNTGTDGFNVDYIDYPFTWIDSSISFSGVKTRITKTVSPSILAKYLPGITYKSYEVLSASTRSLFFHPGGKSTVRSQATGVKLTDYQISSDKQSFSFVPKTGGVDGTAYKSGINGPKTTGTTSAKLLINFDVVVRLYR